MIEKIRKFRPDNKERLGQYHKELTRICGSLEQPIDANAKQRCDALFAAFPDVLKIGKEVLGNKLEE